jgi:hypothetical protein
VVTGIAGVAKEDLRGIVILGAGFTNLVHVSETMLPDHVAVQLTSPGFSSDRSLGVKNRGVWMRG